MAEAHLNEAVARHRRGDVAGAVASYRQALYLRPDNVDAQLNLGAALAAQGRLAEAVACYQEAVRLRLYCAAGHNNLGNTLRKLGRSDQALRLEPGYPAAHRLPASLGRARSCDSRFEKTLASLGFSFTPGG